MISIKNHIYQIIDEFLYFDSWEERYEYLIFLGKKLPKMPLNLRNKKYMISGCQSNAWICAYIKNNKIYFYADSEAIIPRGMIALMLRIYSGQYPCKIINTYPFFIYKCGFFSFLTRSRANGMEAIFNSIKKYAIYFQ